MKSKNEAARRLIVNADDFGLSPGVNAAVIEAFEHGILTSATLLANAPGFEEAAASAVARPGLGVGVHLNLVRGRPLSRPGAVPLLVDGAGEFRPFRVRRLTRPFLAQAEGEYRRQVERVLAAGVTPTHVDFEKHHAWQGPLYRLACRVAAAYGMGAVRNLREPVAWSGRRLGWPGAGRLARAALLRSGFDLGGGLRGSVDGGVNGGLAYPDRLLGQCHIGKMTEDVWLALLGSLPPGASEVMTHPGRVIAEAGTGMGGSWLDRCRERELAALLSPRVKECVRANGIALINFAEL